jgi:hypothetical protein
MAHKRLDNILAVQMTCGANDAVGDVVEITAAKTVAKISGAGSIKIVGTIAKRVLNGYGWSDKDAMATIETKFREMRDDRIAGAAIAVGAFVWNAAGKAINYNASVHDPASIAGLAITATNGADVVVETLEY